MFENYLVQIFELVDFSKKILEDFVLNNKSCDSYWWQVDKRKCRWNIYYESSKDNNFIELQYDLD